MARIEQYIEKSNLGLRIKKRDLDAFHELYKTSFLPLQHYAMRYLYDWKQAEDLVQDAFLSLWDHLERYDEKQPVFYYMLGIIRNNCLNYLRDLEIQGKHQDKIIEGSRITSYCREEKDQRNCNTDGYCRNYSEDSFQTGHGDIAE